MYKINITSRGRDWSDSKTCEGEVTFASGETIINYTMDGDACTLKTDGVKAVQSRVGEQNIYIEFEEGKKTQCTFGSGSLSGSFEILTKKIKFVSGKGGVKLNLEYLSGNDEEPVSLTLTALNNHWGTK